MPSSDKPRLYSLAKVHILSLSILLVVAVVSPTSSSSSSSLSSSFSSFSSHFSPLASSAFVVAGTRCVSPFKISDTAAANDDSMASAMVTLAVLPRPSVWSNSVLRRKFVASASLASSSSSLASSSSLEAASSSPMSSSTTSRRSHRFASRSVVVSISETAWRLAASDHSRRMRSLLGPGLTLEKRGQRGKDGRRHRRHRQQRRRSDRGRTIEEEGKEGACFHGGHELEHHDNNDEDNDVDVDVDDSPDRRDGGAWTALDPLNPVYNFLIEYYGIKGRKGPRRLARWSPDPSLILSLSSSSLSSSQHDESYSGYGKVNGTAQWEKMEMKRFVLLRTREEDKCANADADADADADVNTDKSAGATINILPIWEEKEKGQEERNNETTTSLTSMLLTTTNAKRHNDGSVDMDASFGPLLDLAGGVFLEGATEDDIGAGILHLRGATVVPPGTRFVHEGSEREGGFEDASKGLGSLARGGILYSPALYQNRFSSSAAAAAADDDDDDDDDRDKNHYGPRAQSRARAASPYQWYRSVLSATLSSNPILHCHGLHEWAMQYQPRNHPPPPSAKYQSHLPLRVTRAAINKAVERRGIHCTHVDALRFFAPAAGPLNHHGHALVRTDQLKLEQSGCVHAHMDLLKMAMRLQPFVDSALLTDCLEVALEARRLDVEASPYDASAYGLGVVPVECAEGRRLYRERQVELMQRATPVRERLLKAYDDFLALAFEAEDLGLGWDDPAPERFAKAEPGGLPWRKNLIERDSLEREEEEEATPEGGGVKSKTTTTTKG